MSVFAEHVRSQVRSSAVFTLALSLGLALLWGAISPSIAVAGQPITLPFPRLSMWWPDNDTQSAADRARYDFIGLQNHDAHHIAELRAINPDMIILGSTNSRELNVRPDEGYDNYLNAEVRSASTDWMLTQVGSKITANITNSATTIPVGDVTKFAAGEAALVDHELVFIDAVGTSSLTVRARGLVTPAASHASGARIASVVSLWPGAIEYDLTASCPKADVGYGPETWSEWNVRRGHTVIESADWDGIIIDCYSPGTNWWVTPNNPNRSIDANRDNVADNLTTLDAAWNTGSAAYGTALRAAVDPSKIILANGNFRNYNLNGNIFEDCPDSSLSLANWQTKVMQWDAPRASYLEFLANAQGPNLSMMETYGAQTNYQLMRFGLCTTLMGDGFLSYENPNGHGRGGLYWYDEYDNAGAGRGYLGQPTGAARSVGSNVWRRDYDGGIALVNPDSVAHTIQLGGTFRKIKGTQVPTVNDGSLVTAVTLQPHDGIVLLKTLAAPTGTLTVAGGAAQVDSPDVTLTSAVTGAVDMRIDPGSGAFGSWAPYASSAQITLPGAAGVKTVRAEYRNAGGTKQLTDTVELLDAVTVPDTEAPSTTLAGVPAGWSKSNVVFTLAATDGAPGAVATTYYQLDSGSPTVYTGPVTVTAEGTTTVAYWSVDRAGNVEPAKAAYAHIDRTAPAAPVALKVSALAKFTGVATAAWSTPDGQMAPLAGARYKLDSAPTSPTDGTYVSGATGTLTVKAPKGTHTVHIWLQDAAGNANQANRQSVTFTVGSTGRIRTTSYAVASYKSATVFLRH